MKMKHALSVALIAAALAAVPMQASAVDTDPSPPVCGDYADDQNAIEAKDWKRAIQSLNAAAQRDSRNTDIQNPLGYAYRNTASSIPLSSITNARCSSILAIAARTNTSGRRT